ncbi:hypothetical protein I3271_07560 [Photobacterium leiognathi]|uniref:hypothetical protein n=1 Tax=Photobacterium leiognathi TaxID=553611 RepID=UPI001EDEA372|nr:hypothetical protein [Photobacterium leiognathi]MCG3884543.1 hypothetical protein [Photobacterium leiognathi]
MKKFDLKSALAGVVLASLSSGVIAMTDGGNGWVYDTQEAMKADLSGNLIVSVYVASDESTNIGFMYEDSSCKDFEDDSVSFQPLRVNGQFINIDAQCQDDGVMMVYPTSDAAFNFIKNEFSNKNSVKIDKFGDTDYTFDTRGFKQAMAHVMTPINAL